MRKIIVLLFVCIILAGCKNSTEPDAVNNWSTIYNTDKISMFTSVWNDTTRSVTYSLTFKEYTRFDGKISITENNKYTKTFLGDASYSFASGSVRSFSYTSKDYIGKIHFVMKDSVVWAESEIEFGN